MTLSMTLLSFISLFLAMLVLAATPGPGAFTVVASALNAGFRKSLYTVLGIICGDYVFILLVLSGLHVAADMLGNLFVWLKYAGAAYLVWLGLMLVRTGTERRPIEKKAPMSGLSAFLTGLLVTLGNPKAIFFYLSFFPAFVDPAALTLADLLIILLLVAAALAGTMLGYAWLACRAGNFLLDQERGRWLRRIAGGILIGSGVVLATRS